MIERGNFREVLGTMGFTQAGNVYFCEGDAWKMSADFETGTLIYPEAMRGHTSFNVPENFVVFECVYRLLRMGYRPGDIELEKEWRLGLLPKSGRADICVHKKDSDDVLMIIECKTSGKEYTKALNNTKNDGGQLFSYWQQESSAEWLVLYTSDFKDGAIIPKYIAISCEDDPNLKKRYSDSDEVKLYVNAHTAEEKFTVWHETYNLESSDSVIFSEDSAAYDIRRKPLRLRDLRPFTQTDKDGIVNAFEEILRHNNVSDKENAFNRLIALFISKLADEIGKREDDELAFQYIARRDSYEDLQDKLQQLYTRGMMDFMREEITYIPANYPAEIFANCKEGNRAKAITMLQDAFRKLKYYTNNDFAFKEVHNEKLFYQNGKVLVEVVHLFQPFRIVRRNDGKNDSQPGQEHLLGDLFEQLLDHGFRQNEGQFFTPIPLARFIWDSLPLKRYESWPKVIDYACGAGHFLTEAIEAINHFIPSENNSWTRGHIYGIEKDYRLARVSKVSMFMNGAGESNIIFGDGLENDPDKGIKPGTFDILTANPPYSVLSFIQHMDKNLRDSFTLSRTIGPSGKEIEVLFIERIGQLLKDNGIAAVILPSSILSNDSECYTGARKEILQTFRIRAIVKLGSKTFGATGTNTVILFLERYMRNPARVSHIADSVDAIFSGRNLAGWEDEDILAGYLAMQGLSAGEWEAFIHRELDTDAMPEYFRAYFEAFGEEKFYSLAEKVEREKLRYYGLTYCQRTAVILAPTDNAGQKEFLGYDWSNKKGDEGIHYVEPRGGKMYVNSDREAAGTLADVVRQSFGEGEVVMTEDNARYARVVRLCDLFDFSLVNFNKSIALNVQEKLAIESEYPMCRLADISVLLKRGKSPVYGTSNVQLIKSGQARGFYKFDFKKKYYLASDFALDERRLQKGDILINSTGVGTAGRVTAFSLEGDFAADNHITIFRPNDKVLSGYVLFVLAIGIGFSTLEQMAGGASGQIELSLKTIANIKIPLPPMEIQRQAVSECEKIDAEYNTTRMSMEDYKAKIQAIFHRLGIILLQP